jgi:allantoicase
VELDTRCFVGNAPGWARLSAGEDVELLPRTRLQPDTRHRFRVAAETEVDRVRLDVYPDGGMARVRLWGTLSAAGHDRLLRRWFASLPPAHAAAVLRDAGWADPDGALRSRTSGADGPWPDGLAQALLAAHP